MCVCFVYLRDGQVTATSYTLLETGLRDLRFGILATVYPNICVCHVYNDVVSNCRVV